MQASCRSQSIGWGASQLSLVGLGSVLARRFRGLAGHYGVLGQIAGTSNSGGGGTVALVKAPGEEGALLFAPPRLPLIGHT